MPDDGGVGGRLWLGYLGKPLSSRGIERQITLRTKEAFGNSICPHLFRDISVTELVDSAPDEIGIAHDLLGHADLRTMRKTLHSGAGHGGSPPLPRGYRRPASRGEIPGQHRDIRCLTNPHPSACVGSTCVRSPVADLVR